MDICEFCKQRVHLIERYWIGTKLYHRNCYMQNASKLQRLSISGDGAVLPLTGQLSTPGQDSALRMEAARRNSQLLSGMTKAKHPTRAPNEPIAVIRESESERIQAEEEAKQNEAPPLRLQFRTSQPTSVEVTTSKIKPEVNQQRPQTDAQTKPPATTRNLNFERAPVSQTTVSSTTTSSTTPIAPTYWSTRSSGNAKKSAEETVKSMYVFNSNGKDQAGKDGKSVPAPSLAHDGHVVPVTSQPIDTSRRPPVSNQQKQQPVIPASQLRNTQQQNQHPDPATSTSLPNSRNLPRTKDNNTVSIAGSTMVPSQAKSSTGATSVLMSPSPSLSNSSSVDQKTSDLMLTPNSLSSKTSNTSYSSKSSSPSEMVRNTPVSMATSTPEADVIVAPAPKPVVISKKPVQPISTSMPIPVSKPSATTVKSTESPTSTTSQGEF